MSEKTLTNREKLMQELSTLTDAQFFEFVCAGNGAFGGEDLGLKICPNCVYEEGHAKANEEGRDFTCTCPWMKQACAVEKILDFA